MDNSNIFKVKLESYSMGTSNVPTSEVVFKVMPTITESIAVEYQSIDPIHMPGSYFVYRGTKSSTYEIGEIKLVSRTSREASENQAIRNLLRGWTKPFFGFGTANGGGSTSVPTGKEDYQYMKKRDGGGVNNVSDVTPLTSEDVNLVINTLGINSPVSQVNMSAAQKAQTILSQLDATGKITNLASRNGINSNSATSKIINGNSGVVGGGSNTFVRVPVTAVSQQASGKKFLGAPPEVLYLTAYSSSTNTGGIMDKPTNINKVPVVITNLSYSYPNDVDYIPTLDGEPFPIIMSISLSLVESHSANEFELFDIFKYRDGKLPGF